MIKFLNRQKNYIDKFFIKKSKESFRENRIIIATISTLGAKGINSLVVLITTPITFNYLGAERFGLLMTVWSLLTFMSFSDLGLGMGLQNAIQKLENLNDKIKIRTAISSAFYFLCILSISILLFSLLIDKYYLLSNFIKVSPSLEEELKRTIYTFIVCFIILLPFTIIQKIQSAFQEQYINDIWDAFANITSIFLIIISIYLKLGIPAILFSLYGSKTFFTIINFLFQFSERRKYLKPSLAYIDFKMIKDLSKNGSLYFFLQIFIFLIGSIDSLLLNNYKGAASVASFSIGYRLYSFFMMPVQAYVGNILPAINDALISNDYKWVHYFIHKIIKWLILVSFISSITYIFFGDIIVRIWIDGNISLGRPLFIAFGVYILYSNINSMIISILMTSKFIKKGLLMIGATSIISFTLKILLVKITGIESLLWISIIVSTFVLFIPSYFLIKKSILNNNKT